MTFAERFARCAKATIVLAAVLAGSNISIAQENTRRLTREAVAGPRRVALVVGNNAYVAAPLKNAVPDAVAVAAALRDVGFAVQQAADVDLIGLERAVDTFVRTVQPGDIALFYYSGHGMQVDGENYLIPIDFRGADEIDLKHRSYSATRVHDKLSAAQVRVVILDACRDNPFGNTRSGRRGLAEMSARGSLIAFATGPGSTASDNAAGANGLFTGELLTALKEPGLSATELFRRVRTRVNQVSGGRQFPWVWDGLIGDLVLRPAAAKPAAESPAQAPERGVERGEDVALRAEVALWESIRDTRNPSVLEDYLRQYPQGRFAMAARDRIVALRPEPAPPVRQVPPPGAAEAPAALPRQKSASRAPACVTTAPGVSGTTSCVALGDQYADGRGVPRDPAQAASLYRRACDGGDAVGCRKLGFAYGAGYGVEPDEQRALELYTKACAANDPGACANVGAMHERGMGTAKDVTAALASYRKACSLGYDAACRNATRLAGQRRE